MKKFLSKSEENELIWEGLSPSMSQEQTLSLLLDSKHIIENIVKTINDYSSSSLTPVSPPPKPINTTDLSNVWRTLNKISKQMGIDDNLKPTI
jgi:hypothetical protein